MASSVQAYDSGEPAAAAAAAAEKQQKATNGTTRKPELPLGWTQIRRSPAFLPGITGDKNVAFSKDDAVSGNEENDDGVESVIRSNNAWCCPDPTCFRNLSSVAATSTATSTNGSAAAPGPPVATLQGTTILLLPTIDCAWFQGHFVPKASHLNGSAKRSTNFGAVKAIGLLAVERTDTDECMQCKDGGYREVDLTVIGPSGVSTGRRKRRQFERSVCTGGDMIRLRAGRMADLDPTKPTSPSTEGVAFDAERILTGRKAAPYLVRYFSSVVGKLIEEEDAATGEEEEKDVSPAGLDALPCNESRALEVMPDCAVVIGQMIMTVPISLLGNDDGGMLRQDGGGNDDDDDGFMSD